MADGTEPRPQDSGSGPEPRYSAFISYNKRDVRFVRRLHRELETYRLPRQVSGASRANRRLRPIFRDADELTAAYDLTTAVREAIALSDSLIVVCSPNSAQSEWVGREIELFRELHGDRRIFAALIDGTPHTAFHPALRDASGGAHVQPLAADFRPAGGGRRRALLKLVGGLTGVGLDDLIHRDAQRRRGRIAAGAAATAAVALAVAGLGVMAMRARTDAAKQRIEATGLVDYMLTDLRRDVKRVGSLDQLAAVNEGALKYYQNQDLRRLSDDALQQRAKLLQAMGEDDEKRGNLPKARSYFLEAHRTTAALLAARPNDPKRIFAHAQSEYWVGFINWRNGDGTAARKGMAAYAALARRLVAMDPHNPDWRHELAYSELNSGTLTLRLDGDGATAERHFQSALSVLEQLAADTPKDVGLRREVADAHAWLADSRRVKGDPEGALASRRQERTILDRLAANEPQNLQVRRDIIGNELAMARIYLANGRSSAALEHLELGRERAAQLARLDPSNADIIKQARMLELFKISAQLSTPAAKRPGPAELRRALGRCDGAAGPLADAEIADFCRVLEARLESLTDAPHAADRVRALPTPTTRYSKRWGLDMVREHELLLASIRRDEP